MQISFGMIVSVILIAIFIAAAFYSIAKFIGWQKTIQIGQFADNLQFDIDKVWKSSQGSQEVKYSLPTKIEKVCFVNFKTNSKGIDADKYNELQRGNYGSENLVFYPISSSEGAESILVKHIDLEKMTQRENPFCLDNLNGKVQLVLSMNFSESLVTITR